MAYAVAKSKRGIITASAIGAAIVIGGIVFLSGSNIIGGLSSGDKSSNNTTAVAGLQAPKMVLVVLKGDEDSSNAVTQYMANNTKPIHLATGAHIRFDSPDYRTAEGMKVIARDIDGGTIELLRKSYDVNNEFFINVGKGHYNLQVQASWFEKGSFVYQFDVLVV
jgi:hypothetical protein